MGRQVSMQFGNPGATNRSSDLTMETGEVKFTASIGTIRKNSIVKIGKLCALTVDVTLSARPSTTWWELGQIPSNFIDGSDFYFFASIVSDTVSDYGSVDPDGIIRIHQRPSTASRRISFTFGYALN